MDSPALIQPPSGAARRKRKAALVSTEQGEVTLQPLPRWITTPEPGPSGAAFAAGAALSLLDQVVRADALWLGCLRMRQALKATVVAARMLRLNADEAAVRDALHLTRPGDDAGPAGRLHALLRQLASRPVRLGEETLGLLAAETEGAAAAGELQALLQADLALAQRLGWARPLLLHITAILDPAFRQGASGVRPRPGDAFWPDVQHAVVGRAAMAAHAQAVDMQRKARALAIAAAGLRTRDQGMGVVQVMADDSVAPWRMAGRTGASAKGLGSDRAARRFCETLAGLGVLRQLTPRSTFRLYGL